MTGHKPWSSVKKKASAETVTERQFSLPTFGPGAWEVLMTPTKGYPYVLTVIRDSTNTTSISYTYSPLKSSLLSLETLDQLNGLGKEYYPRSTGEHEPVRMVRSSRGWRSRIRATKEKARQADWYYGGFDAREDCAGL